MTKVICRGELYAILSSRVYVGSNLSWTVETRYVAGLGNFPLQWHCLLNAQDSVSTPHRPEVI